jgi:hypothetical protein
MLGYRREWEDKHSPDGTRQPYWMLRPLKPAKEFYKIAIAD